MSSGRPMIFCDFDGTVTDSDNIIAIMKKYAPSEWNELKDRVLSQEISIREGVGKMFSLLPSSQKEEISTYILENAVIRKGFREFVEYTDNQQIPLYIVSGGIDFFVKPMLRGIVPDARIYCNESDFSEESIKINWPHSCDEECQNECGCCKPSVIRKLADKETYKIVIGDSITDLQAAKMADKVIARDFLVEKCEQESITYEAFEDFFDVIRILKNQEVPS
ncbi:2-hydroxy-3-keto-5-methylthiopentenyl-1-phosphate phosphatase [Bacillus tianshenii]|uniref:2-hydroxy-3-keto-5-methylthiopentenyl-1-phosphate phosphatase n=1 Tax=Sutcliffiella tianshenii TaxID=1463404 RepID=A0ABS2P770_9BACI|nr:2-hydroxy-3-keto-5-methylthiopentenyl-1-phosphate phosphatase [Bacillus tianshenii]MBM7622250.1 2-hydroxy-3-keto-5-methylthiopentenyl-1-phosphate phosphatase [Bacillus tianshenii]